jgi:hypothetical protein
MILKTIYYIKIHYKTFLLYIVYLIIISFSINNSNIM